METERKDLTSGGMNKVELIGDTVHKTAKGHPMVRSYLLYLEKSGMPHVPRFLGVDEQGRDMFSYLPGDTMGWEIDHTHPCFTSEETIVDVARFMRKLHDISVGFLPEAAKNGWENPFFPGEKHETICHGDAGVWNFVFRNGRFAGAFDFDIAYPGTRIWDLTSTLFSVIHYDYYYYDVPKPNDTAAYRAYQEAAAIRKRRIQLFFETYGMNCPTNIAELVTQRIQIDFIDDTIIRANAGDVECHKMLKDREHLTHYNTIIAHLKKYGKEWAQLG